MSYIDEINQAKRMIDACYSDSEEVTMLVEYVEKLEEMLDRFDTKGGDWRQELDDDYDESF